MTTTPDDEYTPTTEQVRDAWAFASDHHDDRDAFDRWLAQVTRQELEAVARNLIAVAEASRAQAEVATGLERAVLNGNARCFDAAAEIARGAR